MSTYLPIWNLLADTSAQNAISRESILNYFLHAHPDEVDKKLDEMYEHRMIGRAKITKGDVTDMYYWRVGVIKNIAEYGRTPPADAPIPPPRRSEQAAQTKPTEDTDMDQPTEPTAEADKPTALRILEYIEAHPDCRPKDLIADLEVETPLAYIKSKIKKHKQVLVDASGGRGNMKIRLAPGLTAEMIYTGRKGIGGYNKTAKNLGKPKSQMIAAAEKAKDAGEEYEIPAFLRSPKTAHENALKAAEAVQRRLDRLNFINMPDPALNPLIETTAADHIKSLLPHIPEGCHITLRHPEHKNIRIEIDGTLLANPIEADLEKLSIVFDAIKTLQQAAYL